MSDRIDWHPERMPTLAVGRVARWLARLSDERLRPVGITTAQLPVIVSLKNGEARTQKELARIAGVEQPTMAQLLARMERDGLVRREADRNDKRSSLIRLTVRAMESLEPGRDALRRLDDDACAGFSEIERETLKGLLERMASNIAAATSAP